GTRPVAGRTTIGGRTEGSSRTQTNRDRGALESDDGVDRRTPPPGAGNAAGGVPAENRPMITHPPPTNEAKLDEALGWYFDAEACREAVRRAEVIAPRSDL